MTKNNSPVEGISDKKHSTGMTNHKKAGAGKKRLTKSLWNEVTWGFMWLGTQGIANKLGLTPEYVRKILQSKLPKK